ncbi:MAG: hypothetical protein J6I85_01595 [Clostridia bacterium]|nr:hypothetical protein [Clostridia bacterium]
MNIASINKQALAQTYYILKSFDNTTKNKVPNSLIDTIKENMDLQYKNTTEILIETKELLYAILNKYILSQSQKDKLAEYYRFYDAKMEEEKAKKYQYEDLFKNNTLTKQIETETQTNQNTVSLVPYKENIFRRIFNRIKSLFNKK